MAVAWCTLHVWNTCSHYVCDNPLSAIMSCTFIRTGVSLFLLTLFIIMLYRYYPFAKVNAAFAGDDLGEIASDEEDDAWGGSDDDIDMEAVKAS